MKYDVVFHLGLEKTGSTFLQHKVFKRMKGVRYHRKSRYARFPQILAEAPGERHFFTFETDRQLFNIVDEVSTALPYARIILILRRADSWLMSKYHYHIRKHGHLSMNEFFDLDRDTGFWKKDEFLLRPKIEYIEARFSQPVLFLNYHELVKDRDAYVDRILNYSGAELDSRSQLARKSKPAFSLKQNRILMAFNKVYPYEHLRSKSRFLNRTWYKYREFLLHIVAFLARFVPGFMVSKEPLVTKDYLDRVRAHYEEDWQYALTKVNLQNPQPGRGE